MTKTATHREDGPWLGFLQLLTYSIPVLETFRRRVTEMLKQLDWKT